MENPWKSNLNGWNGVPPWLRKPPFLVGGLEHELYLFHILGLSSSQLTNSMIFQRGKYTTNQYDHISHHITIYNHYYWPYNHYWLCMLLRFLTVLFDRGYRTSVGFHPLELTRLCTAQNLRSALTGHMLTRIRIGQKAARGKKNGPCGRNRCASTRPEDMTSVVWQFQWPFSTVEIGRCSLLAFQADWNY